MVRPLLYSFVAGALVFLYSCKKDPSLWQLQNLNNNSVTVFGHGGMGIHSTYPLDSYESIGRCIDMGADGSEMDLQMSRDSVLFVYHSDELSEGTNCGGKILEKQAFEITCDFRSALHRHIEVINLSTLFQKLNYNSNTQFTFECKLNGNNDPAYLNAFSNALIKHIRDHDLSKRCFIESTIPRFLTMLRSKDPSLHLFLYITDFDLGLAMAKDLGVYGLTFDMFKITREQIGIAHANNLRVALFNQKKEKDNLKAIEMNADFIQTDQLKHILKVMGKYKK